MKPPSTPSSSTKKERLLYGAWVLPEELIFNEAHTALQAAMDVSFLTGSLINAPKEWLPILLPSGDCFLRAVTIHNPNSQLKDPPAFENGYLRSFNQLFQFINAVREPLDAIKYPYVEPILRFDGFLNMIFSNSSLPAEEVQPTDVSFELRFATLIASEFVVTSYKNEE